MMASSLRTSPVFEPALPRKLFDAEVSTSNSDRTTYDVSPDGRFLMTVAMKDPSPSPIVLILNWKPDRK